jgi:hypothetical protein
VRVSEGKEWIKKGTGLDLISSIVVGKHIATEWAGADIEAGIVVEVRTVAEPVVAREPRIVVVDFALRIGFAGALVPVWQSPAVVVEVVEERIVVVDHHRLA